MEEEERKLLHRLFKNKETGCLHDTNQLGCSIHVLNRSMEDIVPDSPTSYLFGEKGSAKGFGCRFLKDDLVGLVVNDLALSSKSDLEGTNLNRVDECCIAVIIQECLRHGSINRTKQPTGRSSRRVTVDKTMNSAIGCLRRTRIREFSEPPCHFNDPTLIIGVRKGTNGTQFPSQGQHFLHFFISLGHNTRRRHFTNQQP
mmetsp:Transcript_8614/g.14567  ORF Transcript_8614/g.14567 Transcript_8614/m.14567 type:complete len:200 (+) Transcript_8614:160-759(+)